MEITTSVVVECTPQELWPWIVEPERQKQWMKGLLEIRPLGSGPPRAGAEYELVIQEGGKPQVYRETMEVWEPNRRLAIRLTGGCWKEMAVGVSYELEDLGRSTRLDYRMQAETKGVMRFIMPLFAIFGRIQLRSFLRKLKSLAEQQQGAGAVGSAQ